MVDLISIAARLDADEKFKLTYKIPVSAADGEIKYETRAGRLLDVAEDANVLYVAHAGEVIWIKADEAIEITPVADD